jgi:hypothetical protein
MNTPFKDIKILSLFGNQNIYHYFYAIMDTEN